MADYPTLEQGANSTITVAYRVAVNYSENGVVRATASDPETAYNAVIEHEHLDSTGRDAILNHYDANKGNSFILTYDADSYYYRMAYASKPIAIRKGIVWKVVSSLEGIKVGLSLNIVTSEDENVTYNGEDVTYGGT